MAAPTDSLPLLLDGHADTPQRFADEGWHFEDSLEGGHLNLAAARQGGLSGQFFAIWPEPRQWRGRYAVRTVQLIEAVHEQVLRCPGELALCRSADEILAAHASGHFAVLLGIEGGHAIENSLDLLRRYFALGVRYMTLTWANSNDWADSSGDLGDPTVLHHGGLTAFGRDVIREMNRLGMMVDVSHVADATFADVLATSTAPVLASHSCARSLTHSPRNLTDAMLRDIARTGGLVMVNFYSAFIDERWRLAWADTAEDRAGEHAAVQREFDARGKVVPYAVSNAIDQRFAARLPRPPLSALLDHFDHIRQVAGPEHVGLGSDFDGIPALPEGIDSAADLPRITAALRDRGWGADDLRGLCGGNLLRVMRQVEQVATPG